MSLLRVGGIVVVIASQLACGGSGGAKVPFDGAPDDIPDSSTDGGAMNLDGGPNWTKPVPSSDLEAYFADQGIEFSGPLSFVGVGEDYLYVEFRDPDPDEAMVAFFEIDTGTAMSTPTMHFAASLRGPDPQRVIPHYGGRGIAFGHLSSFDDCSDLGYFIEDFARNALSLPEMQLTYCTDHGFLASVVYRVDMRVSATDTYVGMWRVVAEGVYELELEVACTTAKGPYRDVGPCPEHITDEPYGGFFVGTGFADVLDTWSVSNVYVGIVDE